MQNPNFHLTQQHTTSLHIFRPSLASRRLFDSVYNVLSQYTAFESSPLLHRFSLSLSLSAQKQICFITFLMLFVITWHAQHVKSKSVFQRVCLCVLCKSVVCTNDALNMFPILSDYEHLVLLDSQTLNGRSQMETYEMKICFYL